MQLFSTEYGEILVLLTFLMLYAGNALEFLILFIFNKQFQNEFKLILGCRKGIEGSKTSKRNTGLANSKI